MAMLNNQMVYINIFQGKFPIKPFIFFCTFSQPGSLASQQVAELHVPGPSQWGYGMKINLTICVWGIYHNQQATGGGSSPEMDVGGEHFR